MDGARSSVFDLCRQLLRVGAPAVLDVPLEALAERVGSEAARDSLLDLAQAGIAGTLRDALQEDRLDAFAAESCTQREEEALCRTLTMLLGGMPGECGDDDPARLVALERPPAELQALRRWALAQGLQAELAALGPHAGDGGDGADVRGGSLLWRSDALGELRDALWLGARRRLADDVRAQLWASAPPAPLGALTGRLRDLVADATPRTLAAQVFAPARPVALDGEGTAHGYLHCGAGSGGDVWCVRLFLSGHEQRGLIGDCQACGEGRCAHVRALGGRLLDAVLSTDDRLHAPLRALAQEPSWQRFVRALSPRHAEFDAEPDGGGPNPRATDPGQLSFRLRAEGPRLHVSVLSHRRQRGGGYSAGRQVPIARAARSRAAGELDRIVLDAMALGSRPLSAASVPADALVLRALCQHPRVRLGQPDAADARPVRVCECQLDVVFEAQGDGVLPKVLLADSALPSRPPPKDVHVVHRFEAALDTLFFAPLSPAVRRLLGALDGFRGVLPPESFEALGQHVAELRQVARVQAPQALSGAALPPQRRLLLRLAEGPGDALQAVLSTRPLPLGALWPPGHGPEITYGLHGGRQVHTRRDLDWERRTAREVIAALSLHEQVGYEPFHYRVEGTQAMLALLADAARLEGRIDLEWAQRGRRPSLAPTVRASGLQVRLFKRGHFLQVRGHAPSGEAQVAIEALLAAAARGERFVPVTGDSYAEIEAELLQRLRVAQLVLMDDVRGGGLRTPATAARHLFAQLGTRTAAGDPATAAWLQRAMVAGAAPDGGELAAHPAGVPTGDAATAPEAGTWPDHLRDYQRDGATWLSRLSTWAPGACLADEMGLGKTVQAIALLQRRRAGGPALVVAPTSVVGVWLDELQRFAPTLRTRPYRGSARAKLRQGLGPGDVLVTSYELAQRDADALGELPFATLVADEAQWLKNARTARARAVLGLRAEFRVALSGTPIENRLGDLWSLCALIAPGLLGSWRRFRSLFAVPIERYGDDERAQHLRAIVAPFFLRRTKSEVASELPARTEVVHRIELSPAERDLYDAASARARDNLRRRSKHDPLPTAHVLADLTRLRQLACHPRLVVEQPEVESSKLRALLGKLDDILPRGHRALVFSQFVEHLALVREALDTRGLPHLYLDGSTPAARRPGLVQEFQGGQCPLFLISLKAGGTGLSLTAADYVFHLDPWWNPAAEDQASDRAHRIGQARPVTVVKLVAVDTIEERVLSLHGHKRGLADALFSGRSTPAALDLEALQALL